MNMRAVILSFFSLCAFGLFSCSLPNPERTETDSESGVIELSFTPYQSERIVIDLIDNAQTSIYVALYGFDNEKIADALIRAYRRGVVINMATEYDSEHYDSYQALLKEGIPVVLGNGADQDLSGTSTSTQYDALMHNKYFIIDMKYIITGSTNLTGGMFIHFNNLIVLKSAELAADFKRDFDVMNAGYFGVDKDDGFDAVYGASDWTVVPRQVGQYQISAYFTPYNTTITDYGMSTGTVYNYFNYDSNGRETVNYMDGRNLIINLIQNAQKSVRFLVFSFTDRVIIDEMIKAKQRGVDVKIWMDYASYVQSNFAYGSYAKLAETLGDGAKICRRSNDGLLHHKVMWVDGTTLVTGSLNFSKSAATKNDENFLVINNAGPLVTAFEEEAQRINGESISLSDYHIDNSGSTEVEE